VGDTYTSYASTAGDLMRVHDDVMRIGGWCSGWAWRPDDCPGNQQWV